MTFLIHCVRVLLLITVFAVAGHAQITYFEQDFNGPGPFANPNPGTGEFTNLIENNPTLSYFNFQNGAMDMVRTQASDGGSVIAWRSVPFSPNPETLYIQMTFTVRGPAVAANPAAYLYVGENLATTQFPNNNTVFAHPTISIEDNGFTIRHPGTNGKSMQFPFDTPVLLTLVLNNTQSSVAYKMPESAAVANYMLPAQQYDLWANNQLVVAGGQSYAPYSPTKLSTFQLRFYSGIGTLSIDNLRIRDIDGVLPVQFKSFVAVMAENRAQLYWEASATEDLGYFEVERSSDNTYFEKIGKVFPNENLTENYVFTDSNIPLGISYFRVVQIDNSGEEISRSIVRDVTNRPAEFASGIWPNPSDGSSIFVYNVNASASDFRLVGINGNPLAFSIESRSDKSITLIPRTHLYPGLYLLTYMDNGEKKILKLVVGGK